MGYRQAGAVGCVLASLLTMLPIAAAAGEGVVGWRSDAASSEASISEGTPHRYHARQGDTLIGISLRLDIPLILLMASNPDLDLGFLKAGAVVEVPQTQSPDEDQLAGRDNL